MNRGTQFNVVLPPKFLCHQPFLILRADDRMYLAPLRLLTASPLFVPISHTRDIPIDVRKRGYGAGWSPSSFYPSRDLTRLTTPLRWERKVIHIHCKTVIQGSRQRQQEIGRVDMDYPVFLGLIGGALFI